MAGRRARERTEREARRRSRAYTVRQAVFADRGRRRRRDDLVAGVVLVAVLVLATLAQVGFFTIGPGAPKPSSSTTAPATPEATPTPTPTPTRTLPPKSLSGRRTWTGTLTIDSAALKVRLDGKRAPQAVANFVALARSGFYDDTPCHRLTTPTSGLSVLQCGDPTGTGQGGPGYTFGPLENVPEDGVYDTGVLAMARSQAEDSQGSQFFIVYGRSTLPAPGYTVFGAVTAGLPALHTAVLDEGATEPDANGNTAPKVPTSIRSITLH